tara:strand:+ start:10106 stop:10366 length:261 start_codon:yes stop_codon:yes gene_type:complete
MPTPNNFIEVNIVQAVPEANTNVNPPTLNTKFKSGKITFNPDDISAYGEYWDSNGQQFISGKTQVALGLTGFIYNGTVSAFENELP